MPNENTIKNNHETLENTEARFTELVARFATTPEDGYREERDRLSDEYDIFDDQQFMPMRQLWFISTEYEGEQLEYIEYTIFGMGQTRYRVTYNKQQEQPFSYYTGETQIEDYDHMFVSGLLDKIDQLDAENRIALVVTAPEEGDFHILPFFRK